jgi:hypothetical protein
VSILGRARCILEDNIKMDATEKFRLLDTDEATIWEAGPSSYNRANVSPRDINIDILQVVEVAAGGAALYREWETSAESPKAGYGSTRAASSLTMMKMMTKGYARLWTGFCWLEIGKETGYGEHNMGFLD